MPNGFTEDWYREHQAKMGAARSRPRLIDRDREVIGAHLQDRASGAREAPGGEGAEGSPQRRHKQPKRRDEEALQKQVAALLDWALPWDYRWLHIPNQKGTRKGFEVQILKSFGVKPGAADVLILTPQRTFVWIELKAPKGVLSDEQKHWRDWCHVVGAAWFCCRSLDDVIAACQDAGIQLRARAS